MAPSFAAPVLHVQEQDAEQVGHWRRLQNVCEGLINCMCGWGNESALSARAEQKSAYHRQLLYVITLIMSHCITQCAEFNAVSMQSPHPTADTCTGRNGAHTARNSSLLLLAGCISMLSVRCLQRAAAVLVIQLFLSCTRFAHIFFPFYLHNGQIEISCLIFN